MHGRRLALWRAVIFNAMEEAAGKVDDPSVSQPDIKRGIMWEAADWLHHDGSDLRRDCALADVRPDAVRRAAETYLAKVSSGEHRSAAAAGCKLSPHQNARIEALLLAKQITGADIARLIGCTNATVSQRRVAMRQAGHDVDPPCRTRWSGRQGE